MWLGRRFGLLCGRGSGCEGIQGRDLRGSGLSTRTIKYVCDEGVGEGRYDCVREFAGMEDIEGDYRVTHWSLAQ